MFSLIITAIAVKSTIKAYLFGSFMLPIYILIIFISLCALQYYNYDIKKSQDQINNYKRGKWLLKNGTVFIVGLVLFFISGNLSINNPVGNIPRKSPDMLELMGPICNHSPHNGIEELLVCLHENYFINIVETKNKKNDINFSEISKFYIDDFKRKLEQ